MGGQLTKSYVKECYSISFQPTTAYCMLRCCKGQLKVTRQMKLNRNSQLQDRGRVNYQQPIRSPVCAVCILISQAQQKKNQCDYPTSMDYKYLNYLRQCRANERSIIEPDVGQNSLRVIIWDPHSYGHMVKCPIHGNILTPTGKWTDCKRRKPRHLFDINGSVYLISRIYKCDSLDNTHNIISSDEGILIALETSKDCKIPFKLSHKSGLTVGFHNYIIHR